jgi:hypothetical protein
MKEKILNELIKASLKKTFLKIDFSQSIMKKIENYENNKYQLKKISGFILAFFTIFASILSIVSIELFFKFYKYYLQIFNINTSMLKYLLEGFYLFIIISIGGIILKFKELRILKLESTKKY